MAMQMARAVRECVKILEQETGKQIDVRSLSYNRLMNHVKYMIIRAIKKESIKLDLNDYMQQNHPEAFRLGRLVCQDIVKRVRDSTGEDGSRISCDAYRESILWDI